MISSLRCILCPHCGRPINNVLMEKLLERSGSSKITSKGEYFISHCYEWYVCLQTLLNCIRNDLLETKTVMLYRVIPCQVPKSLLGILGFDTSLSRVGIMCLEINFISLWLYNLISECVLPPWLKGGSFYWKYVRFLEQFWTCRKQSSNGPRLVGFAVSAGTKLLPLRHLSFWSCQWYFCSLWLKS